ncbi:MAG: molybdopterin molybdotransferase MoeA [Acidimicrobiales bacterium]
MIPLEEAQSHILDRVSRLGTVRHPLRGAAGLVTTEAVTASENIPPFANTAMDGFAVQAADTSGAPKVLSVVGTIAAGDAGDITVGPGQAARIMTGAPMPPGADAVVMVERTSVDGDEVTVEIEVPTGNHVRAAGEDVRPGDVVFEAGIVLSPGHLGVLASLGLTEVAATPRARVGVLSTGDELVEGPVELAPGQIRDSNRTTLLALLAEAGCEPVDLGIARDDEDAIAAAIETGVADCDALLTSGGVSMGDFDWVKVVLDRIGDMRWMQVAIKPAKPLAFGLVDGTPVFGLPGNPVSSMVSFELFARPALRKMMGHSRHHRTRVTAVADEPMRRGADGKTHFARVVWHYADGEYRFGSAGGQGSHQLAAMATANGLAVIPDGDGVAEGKTAELIRLRED